MYKRQPYARRKTASSACTPRFSIATWPRDGKVHASRAPRAPEAWSKELPSYLILHGDGNNHLYGGGKNHRGVKPLLPVPPSTHALTPTGVSRHHPIEILPKSFCYLLNCLIIYNSLTHTHARFPLYHPRVNFVCLESSKLGSAKCSFSPTRDPLRPI